MKAKKQLIILIGIIVALMILIRVTREPADDRTIVEAAGLVTLVPDTVSASDVTAIELAVGDKGEPIRMKRQDGKWVMASAWNAPVQSSKVDGFLTMLKELNAENVSSNASAHATYGVDDASAMFVRLYSGAEDAPVVELAVGKTRGWENSFVRKVGADVVYEVGKNVRQEVGLYGSDSSAQLKRSQWLDGQLCTLDKEKLASIKLTYPDYALEVKKEAKQVEVEVPAAKEGEDPKKETKTEYEWKLQVGGVGDMNMTKWKTALDTLASIKGDDVVDPAEIESFGEPNFRCEIAMDEGSGDSVVVLGYRKAGKMPMLKLEGQSLAYTTSDWNFERIFIPGADLFTLTVPSFKADDVRSVKLSRGKNSVLAKREDSAKDWTATVPAETEFKASMINDLVKKLEGWASHDFSEKDDAATGLSSAQAVIELGMADGKKLTYQLGADVPWISGSYIKADGSKVLVMKEVDREVIFPAFDSVCVPVKKEVPVASEAKDAPVADKEK